LLIGLVVLFGISAKYLEHKLFFVPLGDVWTGLLLLVAGECLARVYEGKPACDWASLAGLALGLALNTKFIAIMPAMILIGFLLFSVFVRWLPRAALVYCIAAFLATTLCFELFRWASLGSLHAYLTNWGQFWDFFRHAGSGAQAGRPPLRQLFNMHLAAYSRELGWAGLVLLLPLFSAFRSLRSLFHRQGTAEDWLGVITAVQVASFLMWWFFVSNLDWLRHIIPALVLLPFCCHFLITAALAGLRSNALRAVLIAAWSGSIVMACVCSPGRVWASPTLDVQPDSRVASLREVARQLELLKARSPQARFFRPDWWDHWDIQLFTRMRFTCIRFPDGRDRLRVELGPSDYLIDSDLVKTEQFLAIDKTIRDRTQRLVFSNSCYRIYHYLPSNLAELSRVSGSHSNNRFPALAKTDCFAALNDGIAPDRSSDQQVVRFTWWDHCGTREWVQYDFPHPATVKAVKVYWFDDTGSGACRVPQSWRLLYRKGNEWQPVDGASKFGTLKDTFNRLEFSAVTTNGLRLEVQLQPGYSGGILEWEVE
jgi:hypothetical protein